MLNLKTNFKTAHNDHTCPICKSPEQDTMEHLFSCPKLPNTNLTLPNDYKSKLYKNLFSDTGPNLEFFENMAQAIQKLLKARDKVLKEREEQASTIQVPSVKRTATT